MAARWKIWTDEYRNVNWLQIYHIRSENPGGIAYRKRIRCNSGEEKWLKGNQNSKSCSRSNARCALSCFGFILPTVPPFRERLMPRSFEVERKIATKYLHLPFSIQWNMVWGGIKVVAWNGVCWFFFHLFSHASVGTNNFVWAKFSSISIKFPALETFEPFGILP